MTNQTQVQQWEDHFTRYTHPQMVIDDLLAALCLEHDRLWADQPAYHWMVESEPLCCETAEVIRRARGED